MILLKNRCGFCQRKEIEWEQKIPRIQLNALKYWNSLHEMLDQMYKPGIPTKQFRNEQINRKEKRK